METSAILFYFLATIIILCGLGVLLTPNPIKAAFNLVVTMVGVAGVFFTLNAGFLGGVQLAVYAGAVMVLFVMVLMMFDLKKEIDAFTKGFFSTGLKIISAGMLAALFISSVFRSMDLLNGPMASEIKIKNIELSTKSLAALIYTDYILAFELLGLLLLLVAVGAVAISRIKGGTHADV